jgi:hypothetical protein
LTAHCRRLERDSVKRTYRRQESRTWTKTKAGIDFLRAR